MATNAVKGIDVLVQIKVNDSYVTLGGQRGATLNRSAETIDITNKVSGGWMENMAGFKEWSIDCDGLIVATDTAFNTLETAFENGTEVLLQFSNGTMTYTGSAVITDFPIEAPYDDALTYSLSFTGNGALVNGKSGAQVEANKITEAIFGTVNVEDNLLTTASSAVGAGYTVAVFMADGTKISNAGIAITTGEGAIQFKVTKTSDSTTALTSTFVITVEA